MRRELIVSFLLVAAVATVYWPVHTYPFVSLDDPSYVVNNPYVRKGLTGEDIRHAFTDITVGNWHPVTMLSHMLDCHLFGGDEKDAGGHHVVNVALHAANTVLLFFVLRLMTGALWPSALVAALFGLHPLHVESVAWISERKDVLSTLFFMLTLLAYNRFVQRPTALRYTAVFALLALGLMSKPMLVTAPFVLLLLDYWPLNRMRLPPVKTEPDESPDEDEDADEDASEEDVESKETAESDEGEEDVEEGSAGAARHIINLAEARRAAAADEVPLGDDEPQKWPLSRLIVEKIPLLVLAAASALVTYLVQWQGGAMGMLGPPLSLWARLGNAIFSYGQYLEKSFWPSPLAALYTYSHRNLIDVLILGLALAAITVAAVRLGRLRPFLFVGWFWYLGTLVPVIGLVQVGAQSMADRYTYIPLIGIFIIAAWGTAEFTQDWPAGYKAVAAALVLIVLACFTRQQVTTWSSTAALYSHAAEAEHANFLAMYGLGMAYWKDGKLDDAQREFEGILKIESDPANHVEGGFEPAHRALGLLLAVRHQPKQALAQLDEAMKIRPQQPEPPRHKAWILATWRDATSRDEKIRDGKKAVELAERALKLSPREAPEYWDTLAAAQAEAGRFEEAVTSEEKALDKARGTRDEDLIPGIQQRLELFKLHVPYRAEAQPPPRM